MKIKNTKPDAIELQSRAILDCLYAMQTKTNAVISNGDKSVVVHASQAPEVVRKIMVDVMDVFCATDLPRGTGSQVSPGKDPRFNTEGISTEVIDLVFDKVNPGDNKLLWEIGDVDNAFQLRKLAPEQDITIRRMSGAKQMAEIFLYGDGLKIPFEVVYQKQYYKMEKIVRQAKSAIITLMNNVHINLLKTAGESNNTAYSASKAGWTELDRWTNTLNTARINICKRLEKKVEDPYSKIIYFITHPSQEENWTFVQSPAYSANKKVPLNKNIQPIFNYKYNEDNKALMVLPKELIQNAILINEEFDIWTRREDKSMVMGAFTLFGAAVGDVNQVETVALA